MVSFIQFLINIGYFVTAITFIIALRRMSHPSTAQSGITAAGIAMLVATIITFAHPDIWMGNDQSAAFNTRATKYILIVFGLGIGFLCSYGQAMKVKMTEMPQMIAIYNGAGGGSAALIGAVTLLQANSQSSPTLVLLAAIGALIGSVAFTGSIIAWAKLDGRMQNALRYNGRNAVNFVVFGIALFFALVMAHPETLIAAEHSPFHYYGFVALFFVLSLAFGFMLASPVGGADMPVVISLFNALTGIAVAFEGIALQNGGLIIAGTVVGAAGTLLTQLMAKGMNRSLSNVLFSNFGDAKSSDDEVEGEMKPVDAQDAAITMSFAHNIIIVPGYGLAAAQAQHKVAELTKLLGEKGINVRFAIHPVAGRMPGHMNVLIAEAGIPYDLIYDINEINDDFKDTDVVLVIGANDVVNPSARTDESSPIYGMPILNADQAKQVFVVKRGAGTGFSGIENHLFYLDNTNMVYGDAQKVIGDMITGLKSL